MRAEWVLVTGPVQEPLEVDDAKQWAVAHQNDDNVTFDALIRGAREAAQNYLGRAFFTQTWKLQLEYFADVVWLPMAAPLASVTSVTYYDSDGVSQTLSTSYYTVDTVSEPGRIVRAPNQTWPSVQSDRLMPVTITYVCGVTDVANIPEMVKQGMRYFISGMDADRLKAQDAIAAAHACWDCIGPVYWREPEHCLVRSYS